MTKFCGVIHAKGASMRVKRKNHSLIGGVPLFLHQAVNLSKLISKKDIFIDSDNEEIINLALENGFNIFFRDKKFSDNNTGGIKLLSNFLINTNIDHDFIIQIFPPMPFPDLSVIKLAMKKMKKKYNSALLFEYSKKYLWKNDRNYYKFSNQEIPNSVDLDEQKYEIPTFYIVKKDLFLKKNNRIINPILEIKFDSEINYIDIDSEQDFELASAVSRTYYYKKEFNNFQNVRLYYPPIIFWDVDGTLTDGKFNSSFSKEIFKSFHTSDGLAFNELNNLGIINCIVTASKSVKIIKQRCRMFKLELIHSVNNKLEACKFFAETRGYNLRECFFVGNDLNDIEVMSFCGRSFSPINAHEEVKKISDVLYSKGGDGLARDLNSLLKKEKYFKKNAK